MRANDEKPRIAAFFDVDGTIVRPPSLERRLFARLRWQKKIPAKNYFLWLAHSARLIPKGVAMIQHGNKMYLRGVAADEANRTETYSLGQRRVDVPFCPAAFRRMTWHAGRGHAIVLVTGTLASLANSLARELEERLAGSGELIPIEVLATTLEEIDGRWSGRIVGDAMFGEAKVRAMRRMAQERGLDLQHCYAYGDSASDRWMLHVVGRPAAVNPSADLEQIALRRGWPVFWWREQTRRSPHSSPRSQRRAEATMGPRG